MRVFQVHILPLSGLGDGELKPFKYQRQRDPNEPYYTTYTVTNPKTFEDATSGKQITTQSTISSEQPITISEETKNTSQSEETKSM